MEAFSAAKEVMKTNCDLESVQLSLFTKLNGPVEPISLNVL